MNLYCFISTSLMWSLIMIIEWRRERKYWMFTFFNSAIDFLKRFQVLFNLQLTYLRFECFVLRLADDFKCIPWYMPQSKLTIWIIIQHFTTCVLRSASTCREGLITNFELRFFEKWCRYWCRQWEEGAFFDNKMHLSIQFSYTIYWICKHNACAV